MAVTFAELGSYGRMGNAMFQISATIALACRHNDDYVFPHWEYMNDFCIPRNKFKNKVSYNNIYKEPYYHYKKIPYKPNLNIYGYYQSFKYWQDYTNKILELLTPKYNVEYKEDITSIHVRRSDYLTHKGCYNILDMNYYENAMERANTEKFLIFSDDILWCKKHFIGNQYEFSEGNSPSIDLAIMARCSNNIIANSSFSWWGAYLNMQRGCKVIAPATWFGSKLSPTHNTCDLLPPKWIKIDGGNYV